jgi:phosphatidate phosphatase APP1
MIIGSAWRKGAARILSVFAQPARDAATSGGIAIQANRGYGSSEEIFCIGRVFKQSQSIGAPSDPNSMLEQLRDVGRRIARKALSDIPVTAKFYGAEDQFTTDRDGYFRIKLRPQLKPRADLLWHTIDISVQQPKVVQAQAEIFIPSERCRYVVISDIDDTIMKTGVANKLVMLWRLFVQNAASREAFPGVGPFYQALYSGRSGNESNPMLYVSRAPWGIYEVIEEFFVRHGIPVGPILFLREWGISWTSPLPRRAEDHKRDLIQNMLNLYRGLPFVLIGDSGQHDPEVYHQIVADHPNRVMAVYIRNVSRTPERIGEIEKLAAAVADADSSMVLAADSLAMAEHAVGLGLIAPAVLEAIRSGIASADLERNLPDTGSTDRPTIEASTEEVSKGGLKEVLQDGRKTPNVVVGKDT